jgi:tetratricopeptide (TPR) repeat protein
LALKDFKAAKSDFDRTLQLDSKNTSAYYSRATVYVSEQKYKEALPDLDKTIELNPSFPNALTLRGQIRAQTENIEGACKDFQQAKEIGDPRAAEYLSQFCGKEQSPGESLMLHWPEEENWKVGSRQEDESMVMLELIHADETLDNWTEFGSMMSAKGVKNLPMEKAMNMMYDQAKQNAPKAKLTFIEKDETAEHPWILFTIEAPRFNNDKTPESQLYYIIRGQEALYINFRAVKEKAISDEQKEKWIQFFKSGKIVDK